MEVLLKTLDYLVDEHIRIAQANLEKEGEISPLVVGYAKGKKFIIPLILNNDQSKERSLELATMVFAAYEVDRYTFVTEGYVLKLPKEQWEEEYQKLSAKGLSIKDHPQSAEILMVSAISYDGRQIKIFEKTEDRKLQKMDLDTVDFSGRFTQVLPPRDISDAMRKEVLNVIQIVEGELFYEEDCP